MIDFPAAQRLQTNGITLSVHIAGPENGLPVLLLHGWPELARSWINQIGPLSKAGFRVIAPDMRGFGASDATREISAYGIDTLVADMTGLLDTLKIERAVWVGHDWGGFVVWPAALLVPERVAGVVGVNTPHFPLPTSSPVSQLRAFAGDDHYIVRFQEEGLAESLLEGNEDRFFEFTFAKPPKRLPTKISPDITHLLRRFSAFTGRAEDDIAIPKAERALYVQAYKASGFRGGINYYRNLDANWAHMKNVDQTVRQPSLMIGAALDPFLPPAFMDGMEKRVPDLTKHVIKNCGHWTQWEAPDELSATMINWLQQRKSDLKFQ